MLITIRTGNQAIAIPEPTVNPPGPPGWTLTWSDEFRGAAIDTSKWDVWNNFQKNHQGYNTPNNVTVTSDALHLACKRETGTPGQPVDRPYTTGYVESRFSQQFGRWEIKARLPWDSKGVWPALWLRFASALGEIDILEAVGLMPHLEETVHQSTNGDMDKIGFIWPIPAGWDPRVWHVYAFEWDVDGTMRWYIDDALIVTRRPTQLDNQHNPATWLAGPNFNGKAKLRINIQAGGIGAGAMPNYYNYPIDSSTILPADFAVDYVRVYSRAS